MSSIARLWRSLYTTLFERDLNMCDDDGVQQISGHLVIVARLSVAG
jgi:hypothetical protein